MLTMLPNSEEIYNVVFTLNKDRAQGLDEFGELYFQTLREIAKIDVINAVQLICVYL